MSIEALEGLDVARVRAENPGPYTLSGTNTWVVGRDPAWVIDPGPDIAEHLDAVAAEVERRGGAGGIAVTHDHGDHVEGLLALRERLGRPRVGARRYAADVRLGDGDRFGPLAVHSVPGHAPDHLAFVCDGACFTGDAVLGEGSVFVSRGPRRVPGGAAAPAPAAAARDLPGPRPAGVGPEAASSTSTSPTAASASASCWTRSTTGYAARTSCSTPCGTTRRPRCGRRRRSRWGRTERSFGPRVAGLSQAAASPAP